MDVSDTSDYSGSNFSSLSHTVFNEDVFDVKAQLQLLSNSTGKDDAEYKNDLDNLEKVIELKFYKKFDKLMRLNVQLESQLLAANKFINSLQNDTILDSELKKLNFDLNFKINELECELKALKCNIENNEKILDSLRCENEEKSVLIDMKNNSIAGLKNKIVELHLELLEAKQSNLKSDHAFSFLTNELNAIKKSEDWYKKSLSECRLQKSALIEEITNLQLQLISKNRDLQLQILRNLDQKQKNNKAEDIKETCKYQKIVYGENQHLTAENSLLQGKLSENQILIDNIPRLHEKIEICSCSSQIVDESCPFPTPDVSFNETDLRHFSSALFTPDNQHRQIIMEQLPSNEIVDEKSNHENLIEKANLNNCGNSIELFKRKNSITVSPEVEDASSLPLGEVDIQTVEHQDFAKKIFTLDAEIQELKESNTFGKSLLITEMQKHEETVAELGIQYIALQNEVGYLRESNFKYFSELENLQITFQEMEEANKEIENQVKTMKFENQDLKLEKLCYQTQVQSFRTENENLIRKHRSDIEELKEILNTKKGLLDNFETENKELKVITDIEKQKHQETIAELGMQFDDLLNQIENFQCSNNQYQIETSTLRKEIEELNSYADTSNQLLVDFKANEEIVKQDLCKQVLDLQSKIEECENKHNSEIKCKKELTEELKKEKERKEELQAEVSNLRNEIKKCKCKSDLIVLQNIIEELENAMEIKENLIIHSKEEIERMKEVETKLILEVENMHNLIDKLKSEADLRDKRWISTEENQDHLARQVLVLQNEILNSEAKKKIHIENIQKTSIALAQSNVSISNLVAALNTESDASITKLKNENFDLNRNYAVETENLHEIIRKLKDELKVHADVSLQKSKFRNKNILLDSLVMEDAEREENIMLKAEIKRLSALYKAKEMENEENRERCEKGNRSLLNEIKEYKRRCAKIQKMYKQISEEFSSYKFSNISKDEQIECSCDNYTNLLPNFNIHIEDLKQIGATETFVQNGRILHNDEKIATNRLTSKTAMQKKIDNLQEEIDILHADLNATKNDKYFLQRLIKDLKFTLQSYTSQTKMLKKQNDILKSLDCGKFSELLSKMPSPNKCDDTFIKELIKSSCQYQNPVKNLENSMGLFKEEVVRLQKFVS